LLWKDITLQGVNDDDVAMIKGDVEREKALGDDCEAWKVIL
jgi:hypothetical protein